MSKNMKNGTGKSLHIFDYEKKYSGIDFSGIDEDKCCYRNDASIFFYVANSYLTSFYVLSEQIEKSFAVQNRKEVEHLILPYYFNFRHYLELELKALIVGMTNKSPNIIHDLGKLWKDFSEIFSSLNYEADVVLKFQISTEEFEKQKVKISSIMRETEMLLREYIEIEPNVEYYRFIFTTGMDLKESVIELDFNNMDKKLRNLAEGFKKLNIHLREIVYLYFSI